jgi:hypothetical protein
MLAAPLPEQPMRTSAWRGAFCPGSTLSANGKGYRGYGDARTETIRLVLKRIRKVQLPNVLNGFASRAERNGRIFARYGVAG